MFNKMQNNTCILQLYQTKKRTKKLTNKFKDNRKCDFEYVYQIQTKPKQQKKKKQILSRNHYHNITDIIPMIINITIFTIRKKRCEHPKVKKKTLIPKTTQRQTHSKKELEKGEKRRIGGKWGDFIIDITRHNNFLDHIK